MPINVACGKCGQKFAAKDELAGRKVRCPKCSSPLTIPAPRAAAPPAATADPGISELFDEEGIEATPQGGMRCPNCFSNMNQGAVMCVQCGFNVQTGEKAAGFETPDFTTKSPIFRQAEGELKEEARERKKAQDPVAWYWYVGALLFIALNAVIFSMVWYKTLEAKAPSSFKVKYVMGSLYFMFITEVPVFLLFFGHWAVTVWAFQEDSATQGLLCMAVPLYDIIYAFRNFKTRQLRFPIVLLLVGLIWGTVVAIMYYGTGALELPQLVGDEAG